MHEIVNGEYYTQFIYPRQPDDEDRYGSLVMGNDVVFPQNVERGQRFRIRREEELRAGRKVYKVVEAHHIAFTLNNYFLDDYIDFAAAKSLEDMLELLAADTPFTFVVEGTFAVQDIFEWGEKRKFDLLQELRQLYGAELAFDNYTITLTTRKGGNYGARVRYKHNMSGIHRTSHDMERITRLYGYGKNGLTIEGYAGHTTKYINSAYFDPLNPFMDSMEWPEIETQERLLQEMEKHLAKYELPAYSYETDFIQMEKIDPDFAPERIREAGDTVTVYDGDLGYSFDARAWSFDRYPFEPKRGSMTLANFRTLKTSDYVFQATVGSKKAISYTSKNAVLKGQKYDDSLTLVDGMGMKVEDDLGRVMIRLGQIGPGEYGQAMYNKSGDKTIWQDAATGDARFKGRIEAADGTFSGTVSGGSFVGGTITIGSGNSVFKADSNGIWAGNASFASAPFSVNMAGHLKATDVDITGTINATGGTFSGNIVAFGTIFGGTVIGALLQTSASFPKAAMSNTGNIFGAYRDANNCIEVDAFYLGAPVINVKSSGVIRGQIGSSGTNLFVSASSSLDLSSGGDINLIPGSMGGRVKTNWGVLSDSTSGRTLQTELNDKQGSADAWSSYGYSLTFDPTTRNLKMLNRFGTQIATVNIPS